MPTCASLASAGPRTRSGPRPLTSELAEELQADCIVTGHIHEPLVRNAAGVLVLNPGSVGEALRGDLHPRWAWLESRKSGLRAHLERVDDGLARIRAH